MDYWLMALAGFVAGLFVGWDGGQREAGRYYADIDDRIERLEKR